MRKLNLQRLVLKNEPASRLLAELGFPPRFLHPGLLTSLSRVGANPAQPCVPTEGKLACDLFSPMLVSLPLRLSTEGTPGSRFHTGDITQHIVKNP